MSGVLDTVGPLAETRQRVQIVTTEGRGTVWWSRFIRAVINIYMNGICLLHLKNHKVRKS